MRRYLLCLMFLWFLMSSSQAGETVVMRFSAAWCPGCQSQSAHLRTAAAQAVIRQHGIAIWAYDADNATDDSAFTKYGVTKIPRMFLVDYDATTGKAVLLRQTKAAGEVLTGQELLRWLTPP